MDLGVGRSLQAGHGLGTWTDLSDLASFDSGIVCGRGLGTWTDLSGLALLTAVETLQGPRLVPSDMRPVV